jgi:hypothetical protein
MDPRQREIIVAVPRVSIALALVVLLGLVLAPSDRSIASAAASTPSDSRSVEAFVTSANHALSGTFTEVYRLTGPNSGIVELSQQAPAGVDPFPTGHGRWSFLLQATTGLSSQWVEKGSTAWNCWRAATQTTWTCSGPGRFEEANGFILATEPYVPGTLAGDGSELEAGLKERAPEVRGIEFASSESPQFGPLRCLTVDLSTTCIDRSGVLVSQQSRSSYSYWSSITLLRRSSSVSATAFTPVGKSTSAGKNFVLVPT